MKSRTKQVVSAIATGLVAVALAVAAIHVAGIKIGSGAAASSPVFPINIPISGTATTGFSALTDRSLAAAPQSVVDDLKSMHPGTYADAKQVGDGTYLASNNGALCAWVVDGFGQCTDDLNYGDVWLQGDQRRHYDSPSAPFDVHLYGFAQDGVAAIRVTANGSMNSFPVTNNAFRGTLENTSFSDIVSVEKVYISGKAVPMDTASQLRSPAGARWVSPSAG